MTTTMNTGAASLLPCPMCGAAPKLIVGYSPLNHAFVDCDCGMQTALKDTGEEVTAMWNRRSPTPQADAARHPNDDTPKDDACEAALDRLGDSRCQGLDPFWKMAFRNGWHEARAAIAAGGAQEARERSMPCTCGEFAPGIVHRTDGPCYVDETAPLPRVAATVAPEVIAWRDAYQAYVDATAQYNSHLEYVRAHCPFGTSVDAQYQAMNEAQRKAFTLLKPMHAALLAAASNGEQA